MHSTASLTNDLGADSLDIIELVMELEKGLDIEISDDTWYNVNNIQDIYDIIVRRIADKA